MSKALVVLGATGSVGRQTLEVADQLGFRVVGIGARTPGPELAELAMAHPEAAVAAAGRFRRRDGAHSWRALTVAGGSSSVRRRSPRWPATRGRDRHERGSGGGRSAAHAGGPRSRQPAGPRQQGITGRRRPTREERPSSWEES